MCLLFLVYSWDLIAQKKIKTNLHCISENKSITWSHMDSSVQIVGHIEECGRFEVIVLCRFHCLVISYKLSHKLKQNIFSCLYFVH